MPIPQTQVVAEAEETEKQLIDRAAAAVRQSNWIIGEAAGKWTKRYASGRTDADFAELIGSSQRTVNDARRVADRFGSLAPRAKLLFSWVEWREVVKWADAGDMVEWAASTNATFRETVAHRNLRCIPSQTPVTPPAVAAAEPDEPICRPADPQRPTSTHSDASQPATVSPTSLKKAARDAVKALKTLSEGASLAEMQSAARQLRKLADELDPPQRVGKFVAPTVDEVQSYCRERGNRIEAAAFVDFYAMNGWKLSNGNKMIDWRAAVRNWENREQEKINGKPNRAQQRQDSNRAAISAGHAAVAGIIDSNSTAARHALPDETGNITDQGGVEHMDIDSRSVPF